MIELKAATLRLRPTIDYPDAGRTPEEQKRHRLSQFNMPLNTFNDAIERAKPFYAPDVYQTLETNFKLCYKEGVAFEHQDPSQRDYFETARANSQKIIASVEESCASIRTRISSMAITQ